MGLESIRCRTCGHESPATLVRERYGGACPKCLGAFALEGLLSPPSMTAGRFGKYLLTDRLGKGGMGEVWKALDTELNRWVALKFLRDDDPAHLARFKREAHTAAGLTHPGIAAIHEVGEVEGRHFIAMQFVPGRTLESFPRDNRKLLVSLMRDVARALDHAHRHGVIHRDIKPANLMVEAADEGHRVMLLDFGLARPIEGGESLSNSRSVAGTPAYMSPEQTRGEKLDERSDVYALGATLYELLTGKPPFEGTGVLDVVKKVESLEPVAPRKINPHIPRDLETVILKCLEKDKTRRYGSARDLADDLTRWLDGDAVQARPASTFYRLRLKLARRKAIVTVTAVAAAALAGALGWWLTVGSPGVEYAREFTSAMKLWAEARIAANTGGDPEGIGRRARQAREGFEQALHRRETAEGQLMRGRCLQLEGDNVAALKALEAAHRLEPGNAEARLELAKELLLKYHESRGFPAPVHLYVTGGSNVLRFETLPAETKEQRQWRERADQLLHSGGVAPGKAALLEGLQAMAKGDYAKAATALALYGKSESWDVTVLHLEGACRFCARDFSGAIAAMDQSLKRVRSAPCFGYRGLANLALGRYAEAIADLTEAIKLDPRVPKFHVHRGNAKHKFGLLDQAVEDFTQAIEIDPTLAVAYANRALVRGDLGRTDEAIEDYTKAIEIDPHYAMAYQGRGSVKKDLGLVHEAAEDLQKAVQLDPKRASAHVVLGILQCDELREYQAALKSFDQAIALDPDLAIAYRNRAVAKLHLRQLDRAVADLDKAVVLDPKMSGAYRMRGYIKCQLSRPDEGISDYTTAISLDPEDGLAYAGRAKALVMKGLLRESISDFDKAIDINPRNAQAVHNRALTKYRLSQYEEAIEGFTRVIEIDAKWVDAYFQRGRANQSMGRLKEALPDYSKAIELDPNLADAWHLRGDIHEVTGNVDQAVADWGKALDVAPPTWGGRSETVRHLDKYRKDSSRATRIREGQAGFDQSLELLLGKNYAEALKGFRKLAEEFPDLNLGLNSTYNVACCHALLGDKNEALNWLEKAIVLGWNDPAHIEQDTDLESLRGEERYRKLVEKLKAK